MFAQIQIPIKVVVNFIASKMYTEGIRVRVKWNHFSNAAFNVMVNSNLNVLNLYEALNFKLFTISYHFGHSSICCTQTTWGYVSHFWKMMSSGI